MIATTITLLISGKVFAGTTAPVFAIVDRAPWVTGDTIESARGFSDGRGNHWIIGTNQSSSGFPHWRLRAYAQDQYTGTDYSAYPSAPTPDRTRVLSIAFKDRLIAAVGATSSGSGSRGVARISYDAGATWNDLNEFSCGVGQLTQFTSVDFYDSVTVFVSGFCIDPTGAARSFVRRGIFDESEMQWFWSNSDQLVGRPGTNIFANQILAAPAGEILAFGKVQNERSSAVYVRSSTDRGRTWRTVANPLTSAETLSVLKVARATDGRVFIVAATGPTESELGRISLLVSSDNARTWSIISEWATNGGFFGDTADLLVSGTEMIAVGTTFSSSAPATGWLRRSTDGGTTWSQFDSTGEFAAGTEFVGLHQVGTSPVLISGVDRMATGEHRITYRAFRPQ